jgi:hypothetical protein
MNNNAPPSYLPKPQPAPPSYDSVVYPPQSTSNVYPNARSSSMLNVQSQRESMNSYASNQPVSYSNRGYMPSQSSMQSYPASSGSNPLNTLPSAKPAGDTGTSSSKVEIPVIEREVSSTTKIPEIPVHFPELDNLSIPQLERLLADPVAIKAHASSYASVESMMEMLAITKRSNQDRVAANLRMVSH